MNTLIVINVLIVAVIVYVNYYALRSGNAKRVIDFLARPWIGYAVSALLIIIVGASSYVLIHTGTWYYISNSKYTFGVISKMQVQQDQYGTKGLQTLYNNIMK